MISKLDENNFSYADKSVSNKFTKAFVSKKSVLSAFSFTVTFNATRSAAVDPENNNTPDIYVFVAKIPAVFATVFTFSAIISPYNISSFNYNAPNYTSCLAIAVVFVPHATNAASAAKLAFAINMSITISCAYITPTDIDNPKTAPSYSD